MKQTYTAEEAIALLNKGQKIYTDAINKNVTDDELKMAIGLDVLQGVVELTKEMLKAE